MTVTLKSAEYQLLKNAQGKELKIFCFFQASACEPPSSPLCYSFIRITSESLYVCEWSMNKTEGHVTFDLYFE